MTFQRSGRHLVHSGWSGSTLEKRVFNLSLEGQELLSGTLSCMRTASRDLEEKPSRIWEAEREEMGTTIFSRANGAEIIGVLSDIVECWGLSKDLGFYPILQKSVQDSIYAVLQTISYIHTIKQEQRVWTDRAPKKLFKWEINNLKMVNATS